MSAQMPYNLAQMNKNSPGCDHDTATFITRYNVA